eukprot:13976467-Heterocapsa_arctica.AAC.1
MGGALRRISQRVCWRLGVLSLMSGFWTKQDAFLNLRSASKHLGRKPYIENKFRTYRYPLFVPLRV